MRILVLCYEYPPLGGGGGRAAKEVSEQLVRRGHEVRLLTAGMPHLKPVETIEGVNVFRVRSFRRREASCSVPEMGLYLLAGFVPLLRQIRKWKPDILHAHFAVPTGALAYAAHWVTQTPYALTVQLGDVPGGVPEQTDALFRFLKPFTVPIWREAAAITVVSEFIRRLAIEAYHLPVTKIPNGVRLDPHPPPVEPVERPVRLIAVGRFNPQKNFPFLIAVLAHLKVRDWKLTLIGDGPGMREVKSRIADAGLEDRIDLPGWLPGDRVASLLAHSDLLLMPSTSEGMPVAAVEALRAGLAIVGSEIEGLIDVIEPGVNGLRLPIADTGVFAAALDDLLSQPDLIFRMKEASRRKAAEFDLRRIAEEYETVLSKASQR